MPSTPPPPVNGTRRTLAIPLPKPRYKNGHFTARKRGAKMDIMRPRPWGSLAVHGHSTTPTMSAVLRLRREPPRCTARARLPLRGRKREALASVSAAHNMRHYARYTSGLLHQMPATAPALRRRDKPQRTDKLKNRQTKSRKTTCDILKLSYCCPKFHSE